MEQEFRPLFTAPCVVVEQQAVFYKYGEKVVVKAPGKLISQLIRLCDGIRTMTEVIEALADEWEEETLREFVAGLRTLGVIMDVPFLSDAFWDAVKNPSLIPSFVSDEEIRRLAQQARDRHKKESGSGTYHASSSVLESMLNRRRSQKTFSRDPVALQSVVDILWSAYGETEQGHRTVPSAGALYPILIHVALLRKTNGFAPGVYRVHFGSPGSVKFELVSNDTSRFVRSFVDPLMLEDAHGVIVVSGSFQITGKKYGNRSMLYVPLEAGHVAQNVHLASEERDVATVEIGGFFEELLTVATKLPQQYYPLTTVVFGTRSNPDQVVSVDSKIEFQWATPIAGSYHLPFSMAFAKVADGSDRNWSGGKSVSPRLAYTKAVSEAREWAACGCVPNQDLLVNASLDDLETAVDPREVIKFHPNQYKLKGFSCKPFNSATAYTWTVGEDKLRGGKVHVLADLVYFPYYPKEPRYARTNSSGVAAHPDSEQAIENGVLELIERDAFMIAYLTRVTFPTITEKTLPGGIQQRIRALRECGFQVWVKDYSIDLAPVVFIFVQNEELTFTTCAGSANFDVEAALDHALMEVESAAWSCLRSDQLQTIKPTEVWTVKDHAKLYRSKAFFKKANFLIEKQELASFGDVGKGVVKSWHGLLDHLDAEGRKLVTVPLYMPESDGGDKNLHIIRSIVPGLVPITFGYRQEACGMSRIQTVAKEVSGLSLSYNDLTKFPHPFP